MRLAIACVIGLAAAAHAQPAGPLGTRPPGLTDALPPSPADVGRDTERWMLGAGMAIFANYPMSIEDPGAMLFASRPLWLGNRYRFFQWAAELSGVVGFGGDKLHAYAMVGPQFGCNLYFGSVFGLEFRFGVDGAAQMGERTVGGFMLGGSGAYVFRLWDDDRKRLKLQMIERAGFYFADDPGNDLATNAIAIGFGVGYEQPM